MSIRTEPIAVLGAGSWGSALAIVLACNGQPTRLWGPDRDHLQDLIRDHANQKFLPDMPFPEKLTCYTDLSAALQEVKDILLVPPSHAFRELITWLKPHIQNHHRLVWGTKGLDPKRGCLLSDVVTEILGDQLPIAVISGPSFAKEVALGKPTAVTLACIEENFTQDLMQRFHSHYFRVYSSTDLIGVQICGVLKNVIAMAAGVIDGLQLGANSRCALITRGLAEMMRIGRQIGAHAETFMGLAGVGDLILTATDNQSRNRRLGLALGQGKSVDQALAEIGQVVECLSNADVLYQLCENLKIDAPIIKEVYKILHQNIKPQAAIEELLSRSPKADVDLNL